MIIERRQLAWATMLIEPRRRAAASTMSQMPPAVLSSSFQIRTSRAYTAVSESGETSRRPAASTGASRARASPSEAIVAIRASLTRQALDGPGSRLRARVRA